MCCFRPGNRFFPMGIGTVPASCCLPSSFQAVPGLVGWSLNIRRSGTEACRLSGRSDKRTIQLDRCQVQKTSSRHPSQIRYQQNAGDLGNAPQTDTEQNNGSPQKVKLRQGPIGPVQMEIQPTPENIQSAIDRKQCHDANLFSAGSRRLPSAPTTQGAQSKDRRPNGAKGRIRRLPVRLSKRLIPRSDVGQRTANGSNCKAAAKGNGQPEPTIGQVHIHCTKPKKFATSVKRRRIQTMRLLCEPEIGHFPHLPCVGAVLLILHHLRSRKRWDISRMAVSSG